MQVETNNLGNNHLTFLEMKVVTVGGEMGTSGLKWAPEMQRHLHLWTTALPIY